MNYDQDCYDHEYEEGKADGMDDEQADESALSN